MAPQSTPRADQDSPWKRILRQYFREAIEFFFPDIAKLVDWTQPPEFLDKEFVKIAPDAKVGRRFADQLVRVKLKRGKNLVLLLHVEVQAAPEQKFTERIFVYSLRIFDYFRQPAISLAILCDANPTWRPRQYGFSLPGTSLNFEFSMVKLLDYRDRMAELDTSRNPFAIVVKSHLKLQETKKDNPGRKVWKLRLVQQLYEAGYNEEEILSLFNFLDWVLVLPKRLESEFWTELKAYEEERQMPYITSVERIGYDRGLQTGEAQGALRQARALLLKQLARKVGSISARTSEQINALTIAQLETLGEALLDFESIANLTTWLDDHG
jgi:predicted DNA-binding ribbon-helix-helix protein